MLELPGIRRGLIVPIPSSRHLPPRPVKPNHFVVRRTASPVKKPGLSLTERACLATMAAVAAKRIAVHHGEKLPDEYACRIPKTDSEILNFFLSFLAHQGLTDVPVFVNGGYVRDLLLGKEPDDLDLTLCLRDCPEEVTVAALLDEMKGYVESRPELGITEFKNATILSNESKDKQLDTFKAHFTNKDGVKTEVDVMPTIGEEKYSEDNRIPERDQRGLPEEDALRRDLTIGALLLRVQRSAASGDGSDAALEYELFDFYGGVDDICKGMLRSPCPVNKTVDEVAEIVLRTDEEKELAKILKIKELPPEEAVQILWWSKVLIDDPLRICRAFRFAAKFKFELHPAFWMAVPFALEPLRTKVAGSRKFTEYHKIGGYGFKACSDFFELAFSRTFGAEGSLRLASALLGGQDGKGQARMLSQVKSFNVDVFRELAETVKPQGTFDGVELLGELMAAAVAAAEFEGGGCCQPAHQSLRWDVCQQCHERSGPKSLESICCHDVRAASSQQPGLSCSRSLWHLTSELGTTRASLGCHANLQCENRSRVLDGISAKLGFSPGWVAAQRRRAAEMLQGTLLCAPASSRNCAECQGCFGGSKSTPTPGDAAL